METRSDGTTEPVELFVGREAAVELELTDATPGRLKQTESLQCQVLHLI